MNSLTNEKIAYNALNFLSDCNISLIKKLKDFYGSFYKAWEASNYNEFLQNYPLFSSQTLQNLFLAKNDFDPIKQWEQLNQLGIKMFFTEEKDYPLLLKEIPDAPIALYQLGNFDFNNSDAKISIVGTRKPTSYGKMAAEKITKELVNYNFITISGLAYGIDTICHQTTLENNGKTIAVLGSGLNIIFPSINKKLSEKIIKNGALISEYALNAPPLKHHFPARNRIISGLSLGTIVIEASIKSGSLITARLAAEQNREVFAIPGSIFSSLSEGCHQLIQSGAKLVYSTKDVLEELNIEITETENSLSKKTIESLSIEEIKLLDIIKQTEYPLLVDEIISLSGLTPNIVNQTLTLLEIKNLIKLDGNGYRLKI